MENEKKKKFTIQKMCMTAVFMALTCMATAFIQIPIPLGYAHLGDCIILIAAYLCGPVAGALAGGIGSAMADVITGFAIWALPTLLIKTIMPVIAYLLFRKMKITIGAVASLLFMVVGYVGFGCILYGGVAAGLSSAPGLLLKAVVNFAIFRIVALGVKKAGLKEAVGKLLG